MEKILNVYQRILAVMEDLDYIQKGSKKVNGMYSFVSHDQVTAAVHPLLVKYGLAVIPTVLSYEQDSQRTTMRISVAFVNADSPEDRFTIESFGQGIDNSDKGIGKAYSYAYKYALLKTFALETGDDPDNDTKTVHKPKDKESPQSKVEEKNIEDKKVAEFVHSLGQALSDEDKLWAIKYIRGYAKNYKQPILQVLAENTDKEKFLQKLSEWIERQTAFAEAKRLTEAKEA